MSYAVDVVIPTTLHNPQLLFQCLESVAKSDHAKLNIKVFVSVNSTQAKFDEVKKTFRDEFTGFEKKLKIQWLVLEKNSGFAAAMNRGVSAGVASFVIPLNDDAEVAPQTILALITTSLETASAMVAAHIYLANRKTIDSQGFTFAWRGKAETLRTQEHTWQAKLLTAPDYWQHSQSAFPTNLPQTFWQEPFGPDAACCLYTRELLKDLGGFRTNFFAYLEDVDLALRARRKGYACAFSTEATVYHHKHATSSQWRRFKSKQDLINWWRIVLTAYPLSIWKEWWSTIILERLKNLNGWFKA